MFDSYNYISDIDEFNDWLRNSDCKKCRFSNSRKNIVAGRGNVTSRTVMIIGQGPGFNEDNEGNAFIGESGRILMDTCSTTKYKLGIDISIYLDNLVKCYGGSADGGDVAPTASNIKQCVPYLEAAIRIISPVAIFALGKPCYTYFGNAKVTPGEAFLYKNKIPVFTMIHPAKGYRAADIGVNTFYSQFYQACELLLKEEHGYPITYWDETRELYLL